MLSAECVNVTQNLTPKELSDLWRDGGMWTDDDNTACKSRTEKKRMTPKSWWAGGPRGRK